MSDAELIAALTRTLTYREREIIKLRYGLGDDLIYTLEEVSRIFATNPERVRQIEKKALRKMKESSLSGLLAAIVRRGLAEVTPLS